MTNKIKDQQTDKRQTLGNMVAGATGAAIATGIAIAAIALKDEKSRKKVKNAIKDVKDQAIDYAKTLKTDPNVKKGISEIEKVKEETEKIIDKNLE